MIKNTWHNRGFTLIELLVVIAVIGILASVVLASLNSARSKARDAQRKSDLGEIAKAMELYRNDNAGYIDSVGWTYQGGLGPLTPAYISKIANDPTPTASYPGYQYWRKDYTGYTCMTLGQADHYGLYAKLENPSASDLATLTDSFDACVATNWGMNYKVGN